MLSLKIPNRQKIIYNQGMPPDDLPETYRPELLSRKGEGIAWGLAVLVAATWAALATTGYPVHLVVPVLTIVLALSGGGISLSNWMDRHTQIRLDGEGVTFDNGLRHTSLTWCEIRQVQVFPGGWGSKVRVIGPHAAFDFRTLGEVKLQGEVKGRMGFMQGEKILHQILQASGLKEAKHTSTGYYYSRE
jgi:hypothetical protein